MVENPTPELSQQDRQVRRSHLENTSIPLLTEREATLLWQHRLTVSRELLDSENRPMKVVYPGRPNSGAGADFCDAVVYTGGLLRQGCIEVHTQSANWRAHGHHLDPAYNRVILHVALEANGTAQTFLQNGQVVPTVILGQSVSTAQTASTQSCLYPCQSFTRYHGKTALLDHLTSAGLQRFYLKAAGFHGDSPVEFAENFFQAFMEALGYAQNKEPFRQLARLMPLKTLENFVRQLPTEEETALNLLHSLLLGKAGLLFANCAARQLPASRLKALQHIWHASGLQPALCDRDWILCRVRPGNHPIRRLLALGYLILRYRARGLFGSLLVAIRSLPVSRTAASLEQLFTVNLASETALLGGERAAEIVVNVFLPAVFAWSISQGNCEAADKILDYYRHYPRLPVNSLVHHMLGQLSLSGHDINGACQQQGLIHIFQTMCRQGQCHACTFDLSRENAD